MTYLHWKQQTITDFSETSVSNAYNDGFVFTRLGKGIMQQTRSVRINLKEFELSSENRRILKKASIFDTKAIKLPFKEYSWQIGKLGKDFYAKKFGPNIMSAQKIKEMISDSNNSNWNTLLAFSRSDLEVGPNGYAICYTNQNLLHYSYPFYDLTNSPKDMGLCMMTLATEYAKSAGLKYVYLGSLQRPTDTYKLQFKGLEWFDGKNWQTDLEEVKKILASTKIT